MLNRYQIPKFPISFLLKVKCFECFKTLPTASFHCSDICLATKIKFQEIAVNKMLHCPKSHFFQILPSESFIQYFELWHEIGRKIHLPLIVWICSCFTSNTHFSFYGRNFSFSNCGELEIIRDKLRIPMEKSSWIRFLIIPPV